MRKIPTLFARDWDGDRRYVLPEVTPGCEWVTAGEGTPTRKYDGTCMMFDGEAWWARREVKEGKTPPAGFVELEHDGETGKTVGWEPAFQSGFAKHLANAVGYAGSEPFAVDWMRGWIGQHPPEGVDPDDKWGPWMAFPLAERGQWHLFGWVNT